MRFGKLSLPRGAVVLTAVASLVAALVATPTLAESVFDKHEATKVFFTKKRANGRFVTNKDARKTYLKKDKAPEPPVAAAASSNVAFTASTAIGTQVPQANVTFKLKEPGLVVLTFSGAATCTASADGVPCPIRAQVDAQDVSTGRANFALSTSTGTPQPLVHTVVQTVFLQKGTHQATVFYAGSTNPSLTFKLSNWNLIAQAYPGA